MCDCEKRRAENRKKRPSHVIHLIISMLIAWAAMWLCVDGGLEGGFFCVLAGICIAFHIMPLLDV